MWSKNVKHFPGFTGRALKSSVGLELRPRKTPEKTPFAGRIFPAGGVFQRGVKEQLA